MERVHQLVAEGTLDDEDDDFWAAHWMHIASAKVPLETKVAAYNTLQLRGAAYVNDCSIGCFYKICRADRAFVAELDLDADMLHCYRAYSIWIDDDVAALAKYDQEMTAFTDHSWSAHDRYFSVQEILQDILLNVDAPRCMRFLLQDQGVREVVLLKRWSPLVQRLVEELVQPTDRLDKWLLLAHGQSVKLIGMCVPDEELGAEWLKMLKRYPQILEGRMSAMFARKLHASATPEQNAEIKTEVLRALSNGWSNEGYFELAWLFGLLGPSYRKIQRRFLRYNVDLFPAFTFAMIVGVCDGYLKVTLPGIRAPRRRFFMIAMQLPMDLQALVSLRLWGRASTIIPREKFDRAFLAVS
jgi:hypothetical protein